MYIAIEMRNWSPGQTARKKPAKLEPIAGASLDVKDRATRGLRRRKAFASLDSNVSRSRRKKRRSSLWKRRMRARELLKRTLGDFQMGKRGCCLSSRQHTVDLVCRSVVPLHLPSRHELCRDQLPCLQPGEGRDAQAQRRANSRDIVVVSPFGNGLESLGIGRALLHGRRA